MKISISSDTSNVIAGGVVTFNCSATIHNSDLIHYDWVGPHVNNGSITETTSLMLSSISLFNAGQKYTCTANDSISTAVNLHFQSKLINHHLSIYIVE